MPLGWKERPDDLTCSAEETQWCKAPFTGSQTADSFTPHSSRNQINWALKKCKNRRDRKNRSEWLGLARTSLSGLSYLPLCPWARHISSLMNKPIKRARSISLSSFLSLPSSVFLWKISESIICWAGQQYPICRSPFTLRILLDRVP